MSQSFVTYRRTIKDTPYNFERNEFGWGAQCLGSPTDRFHRSYQINTDKDGAPVRCSCPDAYHRGGKCKHILEVEAILTEEKAKAKTTKPCWLRNKFGWVLCYSALPCGTKMLIERNYRGQRVGDLEMSVPEAREHYRSQRKAGFETIEGDL